MSGAHLHLLVNHVPILRAFFALALLAASFFYAPEVLRRTALVVLIGVGLAGAVANYTGDPAEEAIRGFPGVRRSIIHDHEEMGEASFFAAAALGVVAVGALVRWRRSSIPRPVVLIILVGTVAVSGMMGYTGLLGGRVRHTEVRPGATAADAMSVEARRAPKRPSAQQPPAEP